MWTCLSWAHHANCPYNAGCPYMPAAFLPLVSCFRALVCRSRCDTSLFLTVEQCSAVGVYCVLFICSLVYRHVGHPRSNYRFARGPNYPNRSRFWTPLSCSRPSRLSVSKQLGGPQAHIYLKHHPSWSKYPLDNPFPVSLACGLSIQSQIDGFHIKVEADKNGLLDLNLVKEMDRARGVIHL